MAWQTDLISQVKVINGKDAQKNWTKYLDSALRQPVVVKHSGEKFLTISLDQLKDSVPFTLVFNQEVSGGSHLYFSEVPQAIGYGEDIEETKIDFCYVLMDYAAIYMEDFEKHLEAPNLRGQLLQMVILYYMSREDLVRFIESKLEACS